MTVRTLVLYVLFISAGAEHEPRSAASCADGACDGLAFLQLGHAQKIKSKKKKGFPYSEGKKICCDKLLSKCKACKWQRKPYCKSCWTWEKLCRTTTTTTTTPDACSVGLTGPHFNGTCTATEVQVGKCHWLIGSNPSWTVAPAGSFGGCDFENVGDAPKQVFSFMNDMSSPITFSADVTFMDGDVSISADLDDSCMLLDCTSPWFENRPARARVEPGQTVYFAQNPWIDFATYEGQAILTVTPASLLEEYSHQGHLDLKDSMGMDSHLGAEECPVPCNVGDKTVHIVNHKRVLGPIVNFSLPVCTRNWTSPSCTHWHVDDSE